MVTSNADRSHSGIPSMGGTRICGWLISWKIRNTWMRTGNNPIAREPPNIHLIHLNSTLSIYCAIFKYIYIYIYTHSIYIHVVYLYLLTLYISHSAGCFTRFPQVPVYIQVFSYRVFPRFPKIDAITLQHFLKLYIQFFHYTWCLTSFLSVSSGGTPRASHR